MRKLQRNIIFIEQLVSVWRPDRSARSASGCKDFLATTSITIYAVEGTCSRCLVPPRKGDFAAIGRPRWIIHPRTCLWEKHFFCKRLDIDKNQLITVRFFSNEGELRSAGRPRWRSTPLANLCNSLLCFTVYRRNIDSPCRSFHISNLFAIGRPRWVPPVCRGSEYFPHIGSIWIHQIEIKNTSPVRCEKDMFPCRRPDRFSIK